MGLEFWTKLVRILALHELWSDVEMLIGIATEQHPEFSPPIDVNLNTNNSYYLTLLITNDYICLKRFWRP